jgi:ABC-2 type transport system permease protein
MNALLIARANVVRMFRDRLGLVFVFALPVVIIVVMGLAFGGGGTRYLAITDADLSALSGELITNIERDRGPLELKRYESPGALRDAVQRNMIEMGLVIPAGYEAAILSGGTGSLEYVSRPEAIASAIRPIIEEAVHHQNALLKAARFAAAERGISFDEALADARHLEAEIGVVGVTSETSGEQIIETGMNGYIMGAQSQLVLWMFMTSMTAATQLIVSRQLGVTRRMFATPTNAWTILLGELLGRFAVAMIQGLFIFVTTAFVFGVEWGNPIAAGAIIVAFGLVSTGVAMLVGSIATNAEQASSIGVGFAMLLGAFGGAMVPPEVFPEIMRTVSHVTPHAWAIDGLRAVAIRDADLAGVLLEIGVLLGFAMALIGLATVRFRQAATS